MPLPVPQAKCADLDNGRIDSHNDPCSWYTGDNIAQCGAFDYEDFTARTMCCACGGGSTQAKCADLDNGRIDSHNDPCSWYTGDNIAQCGNFDDDDFTARTMCCACGGGSMPLPVPQAKCADLDNGRIDSHNDPCSWYTGDNIAQCGNLMMMIS